jgi:cysteinyl-tRNA synthetase
MLQAHYRSILDFSDDAIVAAEKRIQTIDGSNAFIKRYLASAKALLIFLLGNKCYDAMNDDFNTPILIAQLFEAFVL